MHASIALALLPALASAVPLTRRDNVTSDPYTPSGGVNVSLDIKPTYSASSSSFDFQSINLGLNQEWIELDLFHFGLAKFSDAEFEQYGIDKQARYEIEFFANQETGHARVLTNMLGQGAAALPCEYEYPFETVPDFIDFCQKLTRWGESGVYGFLGHLNDQSAGTLLLQSIVTEARQQFAFRELEGLRGVAEYHVPGIPQAYQFTLLQPYLKSCPASNPHIQFQIFPELRVSSPNVSNAATGHNARIFGQNLTDEFLTKPGQEVQLSWDGPGKVAAYNQSQKLYNTSVHQGIGAPSSLAWISQLNVTYSDLYNVSVNQNGSGSAITYVPGFANLFPDTPGQPVAVKQSVLAGTIFVAVTDAKPFLTPYNLSGINAHTVAGPAIYQFETV